MNNKLTDERIAYLIDVHAGTTVHPALLELQERRKADSAEPVAYMRDGCGGTDYSAHKERGGIPLYAVPRLPQSAPVVPDGLRLALSNAGIAAPESDEMLFAAHEKYVQLLVTWVKERKPFQPVPVVPEEMNPTTIREVAAEWGHELDDDEANAAADSWNACRAAMLQAGNSPVTQSDWVLVPKRPTQEMMDAFMTEIDKHQGYCAGYLAMLAAAPQQESE